MLPVGGEKFLPLLSSGRYRGGREGSLSLQNLFQHPFFLPEKEGEKIYLTFTRRTRKIYFTRRGKKKKGGEPAPQIWLKKGEA